MMNEIINKFHLKESNILSIFSYGSRVYRTHNEKSDYDYIVICKNGTTENDFAVERDNISLHLYEEKIFQDQLNNHKVSALECFYLPENLIILNKKKYPFVLDLNKLRSSFSEKASHAWVKAKKKFEVEKDKNIYIAKKSLFHSLRIIDFGIQIATYKKIVDYSSSNHLWLGIITNPSEEWQPYKEQYQELYNSRMTEFRKVAPK